MPSTLSDYHQSVRAFERFAELEQLGDGVPVAASEGKVQEFFNARPREIWTGLAIGKIDEKFATADVQFFGSNIHGKERFSRLCAGFAPEECDNKLAGVDSRTLGKRSAGNDLAKLGDGPHNDVSAETELALDRSLERFRELSEVLATGAEDDIAALQVGLWVLKFQRETEVAQDLHFDFVVSSKVNATKQGDDDGHGDEEYSR